MSLATLDSGEVRLTDEIRRRAAKRTKTRKRFLVVSLAVLLVVGAALGVSFLGSTGTTSISISSPNATESNFVVTSGVAPEPLVHGTGTPATTFSPPSWSPVAGAAGSVTTPGDLAFFNASAVSDGLDVSAYITNLPALQSDYSSFALPVQVWYLATVLTGTSTTSPATLGPPATSSSTCSAVTTTADATTSDCVWEPADGSVPSDANAGSVKAPDVLSTSTYITNDSGSLQLNLTQPGYYELTMEKGGSFYCTSTTSTNGALGPEFFYTATAY
ncbi:MAG: hypothetical protein M0004_09180 [Actinomycetota bacterium]|nr:hypothetical protein [Actinomycetota bacterium]